jgi:hypothetical protein
MRAVRQFGCVAPGDEHEDEASAGINVRDLLLTQAEQWQEQAVLIPVTM